VFRFTFYFSRCIFRRRMRTSQHNAFAALNRYDILYGGHKSDAGVGSGRRRRFLMWISLLHNVVKRVRNRTADSIMFSVVQTFTVSER
jgi:hypothetical protein